MKTSSRMLLPFAALALVSLTAGGCMLQVEADVPDVEITQHDLVFTGVPAAGSLGDVSLSKSFSQQHQRLDLPSGLTTEVKALSVTLTAKTGITTFDFLQNLRLTMSDGVHDPVELINYERDPSAPSTTVLTMPSANPVNTLDEWKTNSATFTVTVAGQLPSQDWTVDLSVDFSGKIKYKY
jgi:hypothetical protein